MSSPELPDSGRQGVGNDGLRLRHPIAFDRRELQAAAGYRRPAGADSLRADDRRRAAQESGHPPASGPETCEPVNCF